MRKASFDLSRVLAIAAVILVHTVMLFWDFDPASPTWILYNYISLSGHYCIPLFFMVSGALLLGRECLDFKRHLRRMGHFVLLFYIWSAICYGLDAAFFHVWTPGENFLLLVLAGYFHEWFLPALVLCYAAMPLLHGMIHGNQENTQSGAWLLCGLIAVLSTLRSLPDKSPLFAALMEPWNIGDLRYLIFFVAGWLLSDRLLSRRALTLLGAGALLSQLLLAHINRRYAISIGGAIGVLYGNYTIAATLTAIFVFCLCRYFESALSRFAAPLKTFSSCTFGIYLLHPVFIDTLRSMHLNFTDYCTFWFFPLCYLSFLLLPLAVTYLLKKIPLLRDLVS